MPRKPSSLLKLYTCSAVLFMQLHIYMDMSSDLNDVTDAENKRIYNNKTSVMHNFWLLYFFAVQSLYADTHPEYLKYIYLIAPISVIVLNPIGFVLLEIQNHREREAENASAEIKGQGSCMPLSIGLHVIKGVITNPIVFMTVIGIIGNFVFHRNIPDVLSDILDVFGRFTITVHKSWCN